MKYVVKGNEILKPGIIPGEARILIFGFYFNQPLEIGVIPRSITSITFGGTQKQYHLRPHPFSITDLTRSVIVLDF